MTGDPDRSALEPDRWNLNLVAVGVVVAVVLAAVAAWAITGDGDEESGGGPDAAPVATQTSLPDLTTSAAPTTVLPAESPPPTTSAQPMPEITTSTAPAAPSTTTVPPPAAPVTAAAAAGPGAVPGDLGVEGHPMQRPPCEGAYITIVASGLGGDVSAAGIEGLLEQYPGAAYLRTDQTCPSLSQSSQGQPIYVVYYGPFAFDSDACQARASGPPDAYAKRLTTDPSGGNVTCPPAAG